MAKVEIYTRDFCPFCTRALNTLKSKGVEFTQYDAGIDADLKAEMISRANGGRTFPQIFIDDVHIGGSDDMQALDANGKLDKLLSA